MKRLLTFACVWVGVVSGSLNLAAQNLVITNARIIDGNGGVIADGSVVVEDGRIVSVGAGDAAGVETRRARNRRPGPDSDARVHRCPPAHH